MRGVMLGMREILVGVRGMGESDVSLENLGGNAGNRGGKAGIRVRMQGIGVKIWGIQVGMQKIGLECGK